MQLIVEKTDGVPLFVEELTKTILESDYLQETNGHYAFAGALSAFAIPGTLQDSLMARLDHLVTAKGIAQLATVPRDANLHIPSSGGLTGRRRQHCNVS